MSHSSFFVARLMAHGAASALFLAIAAPAFSQNDAERQIVVTGTPLSDTAKALADCIARNCPVDEEIRAALAHAENQFVAGKYRDAKSTLYKTVGRTRKYGADYPIEVSDLFRARSRVAEHLGEPRDFQISVLDMRDVLRMGVGRDDPRALIAQIEVGESRDKLGFPEEAMRIYDGVETEALSKGEVRIAEFATLRKNILLYNFAIAQNMRGDARKALSAIEKLADSQNTAAPDVKIMANVTLARLERSIGRMDRTNALVQQIATRDGATKPVLLSSEPIKMAPKGELIRNGGMGGRKINPRDTAGGMAPGQNIADLKRFGIQYEGRWADIGYWINANGNVQDIELLRSGGSTKSWLNPIVTSIQSRIYAPLNTKKLASEGGIYMVERYTYTADYFEMRYETGTRIARRGSEPKIVMINLTAENYEEFPAQLPANADKPAN
jgi:hypothetical protein